MDTRDTQPQAIESFLSLDEVHAELDELFLRHQEALLTGQSERAIDLLATFTDLLHLHMRHEEEILLPRFEAWRQGQDNPDGLPAEVYTLEHAKIRERLTVIQKAARTLHQRSDRSPRDLIALLDLESAFKLLVEHHDRREHNLLYPALDHAMTEEDRSRLLSRCRADWKARSPATADKR